MLPFWTWRSQCVLVCSAFLILCFTLLYQFPPCITAPASARCYGCFTPAWQYFDACCLSTPTSDLVDWCASTFWSSVGLSMLRMRLSRCCKFVVPSGLANVAGDLLASDSCWHAPLLCVWLLSGPLGSRPNLALWSCPLVNCSNL